MPADAFSRCWLTLVFQIAVMSTASPYFSCTPQPLPPLLITSVRLPTSLHSSPTRHRRLRTPAVTLSPAGIPGSPHSAQTPNQPIWLIGDRIFLYPHHQGALLLRPTPPIFLSYLH